MIIGILQVEIFIPLSHSLKSKRRILKSIKDRIRSKFNVSVSETEYQHKWQRAIISCVIVGNEKKYLNQVLENVFHVFTNTPDIQIIDRILHFM